TRAFSDEHEVELSKVFEAAILCAATARSAVSSTITVTLPAPTPTAGVPLEYARRTLSWLPVTTARSASSSRRWVSALVPGGGIVCTRSRSSPILSNSAWMNSSSIVQQPTPLGDGDRMIALPHFSALMTLLAGVAAGLV